MFTNLFRGLAESREVARLKTAWDNERYNQEESLVYETEKLRPERAAEVLVHAISSDRASHRGKAINAIRKYRDPRAINALVALLHSHSTIINHRSVEGALIDIGPAAIAAVIPKLSHPDPELRAKALYTLEKIKESLPKSDTRHTRIEQSLGDAARASKVMAAQGERWCWRCEAVRKFITKSHTGYSDFDEDYRTTEIEVCPVCRQ